MIDASTAARLEARRAWIGASDMAAILGVSRYANAADVYWRKVAQLDGVETKATERGRYMERGVLDWFADQIGEEIERDVTVAWAEDPLFVAQLDGRIVSSGIPVEAKTGASDEEWGDEYTDQVPDAYLVQAHVQMLCAGADVCHLPALVAGFRSLEFRRYLIQRNEGVVAEIVDQGREFWKLVEARTPPDGFTPSLETVKRIRRAPSSMVELTDSAVVALADLEAAKDAAKDAEARKEEAQARVLALLGDAEAGVLPDGRTLTYLSQNSAPSVNHKLLAANWPDAVAACVTRSTHRVLRIKKAA